MNLTFEKVVIESFKTFVGEPQTFVLAKSEPGLHFIKGINKDEPDLGSNGAAKSSIFDALGWCLYGRTPDGRRTPDIVPWSGKGHPKVTTTVRIDQTRHEIVRTTHPNQLLLDKEL